MKDVESLLFDPARARVFNIQGSNQYFRGIRNAKPEQRNMEKTLLACLVRFHDQNKSMAIVCTQIEDAISSILQECLQHPSPARMPVRAKTSQVTVRHSRDSIFKKPYGNVSFCKMEGDYDALLVVCVYCVVEHVLHVNKSSKYGQEVDDALRVDRILARIYEQVLDESVNHGAALSDDGAPPETPVLQDGGCGLGSLDVHDGTTMLGMDLDQPFWDALSVPESMVDGVAQENPSLDVQRMLEVPPAADERMAPSEDWHDFYPFMESDLHFDDLMCDDLDLQEFEPWELEQVLL